MQLRVSDCGDSFFWLQTCPQLERESVKKTSLSAKITLKRMIITLNVAKSRDMLTVTVMVTARQIRAARALLGWSQQNLADEAIVALNAVTRLERGEVDPRMSTMFAVEKAIRKAGIEFISADDRRGEGVRMANAQA
jgi:ribosome-binding protein aMBF1 (putative translation factor)